MVTKIEKRQINNIVVEKIMTLDVNKKYLFHIPNISEKQLKEVNNILINNNFREDNIIIRSDDLTIYEIKENEKD